MIKTKRKAICICAVAAGLTILSGCTNKKKDIEYVDNSVVASSSDAEEISTGDKLHDKLGIGEEKEWKDKVGKTEISVWVKVPDTTSMYTQKFEEYYYTNSDKKHFVETVFDKDSQRVDTMSIDYPCRESIEKKIANYEKEIGYQEEYIADYDDPNAPKQIEYYNKKIEALKSQLGNAPARAEVSTNVGDYSSNQYRATINGIEYSIKFEIDPDNNKSKVFVVPIDYSPFNNSNVNQTPNIEMSIKSSDSLNVSEKGCDKLKQEAERFINSLGITGFVVSDTAMLRYYNDEKKDEWSLVGKEFNGYSFLFTRQIVDVDVGCRFYMDTAQYRTDNRPYAQEYIIVRINDTGLVGFVYNGIMKPVSEPSAVKLLAYEDIKQVGLNAFEHSSIPMCEGEFRLGYERVASSEIPDTYCYVPTWRFSGMSIQDEQIEMINMEYHISINAIDGSVTDWHNRVADGTVDDFNYETYEYNNYR